MIDRFGLLPAQAKNLIRVTALKLRAEAFGIARVEAGSDSGMLVFERRHWSTRQRWSSRLALADQLLEHKPLLNNM